MNLHFYKIFKISFWVGIILISVNIFGLFIPLGNDAIYTEKAVLFNNDISQDPNDINLLKKVLSINEVENRKDYVAEVVKAVNKNIAHYWRDKGRYKYSLTIPFYENYLLWLAQYFYPKVYKKYEFCDYQKAIERKVGLCSQHSIIICGILEDKKIPCKIVGLSGHVVAEAEVGKETWWICDGDYGVVIPYSIQEIERKPELIIPYYRNKLIYSNYAKASEKNNLITLSKMVKIYGKEGNKITDGVTGYCSKKKYFIEKISYYLIWAIPIILMCPYSYKKTKELLTSRSS